MKNKVVPAGKFKKNLLLLFAIICWQLPAGIYAQVKTNDSIVLLKNSNNEELKIRQRGGELQLQFPRLQFKSALKIINTSGWVMKAMMVDEGTEILTVSLNGLPKGIYQFVIENRTQRYNRKLMIQQN